MKWATRCILMFFIVGGAHDLQRQQTLFFSRASTGQEATKEASPPAPQVNSEPRNDGWWKQRYESMNKQVAAGNVGLVFIGDSITEGWDNQGKDAWAANFAKFGAVNLGIGGDQTQHVLWRLQNGNLKDISPRVAVLMIGTNNTGSGVSPEVTAAGVQAILNEIKTRCPDTSILLMAVFPRGETADDPLRLANDKVNGLIKPLADGARVVFIDIGPLLLMPGGKLDRGIMPDLLHLSPQAYQTWADAIVPKINELMTPAAKP